MGCQVIHDKYDIEPEVWNHNVLFSILVLIALSNILMFGGLNSLTKEKIGLSIPVTILLTTGMVSMNTYIFAIVATNLTVFGESIAIICGWCKSLEDQYNDMLLYKEKDQGSQFPVSFL